MDLRSWALAGCGLAVAAPAAAAPDPAAVDAVDPVAPQVVVVFVQPPAALASAVEVALAPWHVQVVRVEEGVRTDRESAQALATTTGASRVVWTIDETIIVYDRDSGSFDHRALPPGRLDDATAAAVGLTIKTMLRLPPPGRTPAPEVPAEPVGSPTTPSPRARGEVRAGAALVIPAGGDGVVAPSVTIGAGARELGGWPLGVTLDATLTPASTVETSGFAGTSGYLDARVLVSWRGWRGGDVALDALAGVAIARTTLRGNLTAGGMVDERAVEAGFVAGGSARWERWSYLVPRAWITVTAGRPQIAIVEAGGAAARYAFDSPWATLDVGVGVSTTF
ncbi:MAG: hypothetical protein R2939_14675 [Kofleriaceae bacterium]